MKDITPLEFTHACALIVLLLVCLAILQAMIVWENLIDKIKLMF